MDERERVARDIRDALAVIVDPEIGRSIVDLGLIYGICVEEGGIARVTMTTTVPGCPASGYLREAVEACVRQVPGVGQAEVRLTYEPPWTPAMMAET